MSGSHFIVYGARHGAKSFFEGISDPTFFMSINRILDEGFYREYFDPRLEKTFSFPGLLEFVTDREGLDISDWVPFMKALRAQDDESAAKELYWRMVKLDHRLDPFTGPKPVLGPPPEAGLANPSGKKKDLGYNGNVGSRGNSEEYVVRRLKRDAPDLAEALARGEFDSARAAGIAAGFVKPSPPSLQLKEPSPTAQKLLAKKGKEWCLELLEELSSLVLDLPA
jgi:hypothetical protein